MCIRDRNNPSIFCRRGGGSGSLSVFRSRSGGTETCDGGRGYTGYCCAVDTVAVSENLVEQTAGGVTTSFRFRLRSGSDYEIIYVSHGVKNGELKLPHAFHYRTEADIGSIWNQLDYEALAVEAVELPAYKG